MENKINILFVLQTLDDGGAERIVFNLVSNINTTVINPTVIGFKGGKLYYHFKMHGIKTKVIKKKSGIDFALMFNIVKFIKVNKISLVNTHHFSPLFYSFLGSKIFNSTKLLHTPHSRWEIEINSSPRSIKSLFWKKISDFLMKRADILIAISEGVYKYYKENLHINHTKIFKIYNAVELCNISDSVYLENKKRLRAELNIGLGEKVIGCIANFRAEKNHAFLIKTFKKVVEKINNVYLILIGDGPELETSKQLAKSLRIYNKIYFLGHKSNAKEFLFAFDIFCLTSKKEGMPISILEAMAHKVPVIGSNVQGINEIIEHLYTGILFDDENMDDFVNKVEILFQDKKLYENLKTNAYNYIKSTHDFSKWILLYENLFKSI